MTNPPDHTPPKIATWFARLAIGWIVLICAELFSGATLPIGFWHPWTWILTYWLYFAHFFFFTTLAVWTRRTSLPSLYLWGVLYGLYESWITKVIWYGYGGDGKLALGKIGPFGFSEISMTLLFHPIAAFILPLAVACVLCPPLRRTFPDLAWLTGPSKLGRGVRASLFVSFAPVMGMNSGGPVNLALNTAFVVGCLLVCIRLGRSAFQNTTGPSLVTSTRGGFALLCVYLAVLYGTTYFLLRPEGLPSAAVQLLTLGFYAVIILALRLHRPRLQLADSPALVNADELKLVTRWFTLLIATALVLSLLAGTPILFVPLALIFIAWTPIGFALTLLAIFKGR